MCGTVAEFIAASAAGSFNQPDCVSEATPQVVLIGAPSKFEN